MTRYPSNFQAQLRMLRIIGLSLLLGLTLLVIVLALLSPFSSATGNKTLRMNPEEAAASALGTKASASDGVISLPASDGGIIILSFELPTPIKAEDFPFLHLAIDEPRDNHKVMLLWTSQSETDVSIADAANGEAKVEADYSYLIENRDRDSLWINTHELQQWQGDISKIQLFFLGGSGIGTYEVSDLSVHTANFRYWLAALSDDWLTYEPWDRAAMNSHTGVTQVSSFYPIPVSAALLFLCLLSYLAIVLIARGRVPFNWHAVGLVFLACWILVDAGWQNRLLRQLSDTRHQFAGLSSEEKLRHGPDSGIIKFVEEAQQHLTPDARVFIAAHDDYRGLRTAYYFYPHNVYWKMQAGLPPRERYKSGDYIAVVKAPDIYYRRADSMLIFPRSWPVPVDALVQGPAGKLYRVQ